MPRVHPEAPAPAEAPRWWLLSLRALAGLALAISCFLAWTSLRNEPLPGCGPDSGCGEVLTSRWGYWLGFPVSLGAIPMYGLILGATLVLNRGRNPVARGRAWLALVFAAVTIAGSAIWFVVVQAAVLHRFCPYCMAAHTCGLLVAGLILTRSGGPVVPLGKGDAGTSRPSGATTGVAWMSGVAAVGLLAAGQILHRPKTFAVSGIMPGAAVPVVPAVIPPATSPPGAAVPPGPAPVAAPSLTPPPAPELELHGGAFRFDLGKVPLLGRAEAPGKIVSLFDYTCSHCRQMHWPLMEAYRARSNTVAILSLPVPLEPCCNSLVKRPIPEQTNACTYARLGLAVWRADPSKLEAFDDWVFAPPRPPSTNEVRAHAESLVGAGPLQAALSDSRIDELLQTNIRLYHTNYLVYGKGRLPQLIIGTNLVVGLPGGPEDIYRLLPGR